MNYPRAVSVHGTELLPTDTPQVYGQKLARITLDSMVQFVALLDAQGNVLEINKTALDAVGMSLTAVEGRPFWTTCWWQVSEQISATLRDSIARAAAGEWVRWETTIYGRVGGRGTIVIDASLVPVKDATGTVVFIAAEGRDITEKKACELRITESTEALRASEGRFRAFALASSDMIYRMSPDWRQMRQLEGRRFVADTFAPDDAWMEKYIHPEDRERVMAKIQAAISARSLFEHEHRVLRMDGTFGWTFSRAVPILDEKGEIVEWFGMASDVSGRKHLESSLREADRRKDEFLATLAHELRNPLAPIRNAMELMKTPKATDLQMRTARGIVERQVRHMVRLVDDLLEVSRITLGQITLRRAKVGLQGILTNAIEAAAPLIEANQHTLSVDLPPQVLEMDADATRLAQVFQNLLNNAARYTAPHGTIAVAARRVGEQVRVSVRDNGIGIPKSMQSRIFDLFTRVDPQDRIKTSGLGIGLALARQLVELHGGTLEVYSEGGGSGSEFIVSLPLCGGQERAQPMDRQAGSASAHDGQTRRRVLIVDDNTDAAATLSMLLQLDGHEVRTASDGRSALDAFAAFEPQVVLLDIGLPDMNGYEVARRIRDSAPGKSALLLAVTGWGQVEDKRRAAEAGFDDHLTKPVDSTLLSKLLET